ncbi:MAG: diacylglycerol kinase family protein [Caldiserica bacterium]|nr:MAG: diacylglycerol kinase family protein [Caldisericota bacterium]
MNRNILQSFLSAFRGLWVTYKSQRNFRIQVSFAILAIYFSIKFRIPPEHMLFVILSIVFVLISELINTSIEILGDRITKSKDLWIKNSKEISAAEVLLSAIFSVIVGLVVFLPYINRLTISSIVISLLIIVIPAIIKNDDIIKSERKER